MVIGGMGSFVRHSFELLDLRFELFLRDSHRPQIGNCVYLLSSRSRTPNPTVGLNGKGREIALTDTGIDKETYG